MDSDLDELFKRARERVLARGSELTPRGEQPFNPEYIEHPFVYFIHDEAGGVPTIFMDEETNKAWRKLCRKKHHRPGRKRGRKF